MLIDVLTAILALGTNTHTGHSKRRRHQKLPRYDCKLLVKDTIEADSPEEAAQQFFTEVKMYYSPNDVEVEEAV